MMEHVSFVLTVFKRVYTENINIRFANKMTIGGRIVDDDSIIVIITIFNKKLSISKIAVKKHLFQSKVAKVLSLSVQAHMFSRVQFVHLPL